MSLSVLHPITRSGIVFCAAFIFLHYVLHLSLHVLRLTGYVLRLSCYVLKNRIKYR